LNLSIREVSEHDVPIIDEYWNTRSAEDLERMKLDLTKRPSGSQEIEDIRKNSATPDEQKAWLRLIWEVDGQPVGMTTLRNIKFGDQADLHAHMFSTSNRNQGLGTQFFVRSVIKFSQRFQLKLIICEPASTNPAPNKVLQSLGLKVVKTYRTSPSSASWEHEVNRYEVDPRIFSSDLFSA